MKIDSKVYLVLIAVFFALFFLNYFLSRPKIRQFPLEFVSLTPTVFIPSPTKPLPSSTLAPTFTGGREEIFPPEVIDTAGQKRALRAKTPFNLGNFSLTFDYSNDVFVVSLSEPKDQNRQLFEQWLKNNYPAIPLTDFNYK